MKTQPDSPKYLTTSQLAELLGLSPKTVTGAFKSAYVGRAGGHKKYSIEKVAQLISKASKHVVTVCDLYQLIPLLEAAKVAEALGQYRCTRTWYIWAQRGIGPRVVVVVGKFYFRRTDLCAWVNVLSQIKSRRLPRNRNATTSEVAHG